MATLVAGSSRLFELGNGLRANGSKLSDGPRFVAVSSVAAESVWAAHYRAMLDAVDASRRANVFHMVMVDSSTPSPAYELLEEKGAAVVMIDHDSEGGVVRPYVIAAQIINRFAPQSIMVKFEGEKSVFADARNLDRFRTVARRYDIVTGERTTDAWASMPPYSAATETWLASIIGALLGVSEDTLSGVILLNEQGRNVLIDTTDQDGHAYLFTTPYYGMRQGLRVGSVDVDFEYHPLAADDEANDPAIDERCRLRINALLDKALACRGGESALSAHELRQVIRLRRFREQLDRHAAFAETRAAADV